MPINYDIEYPKLQRRNAKLLTYCEALDVNDAKLQTRIENLEKELKTETVFKASNIKARTVLQARVKELEERPRIIDLSSCESRVRELEGIIVTLEDNVEAEQRELDLIKQVENLEKWNKEMYENLNKQLKEAETIRLSQIVYIKRLQNPGPTY